MRIYKIAQIWDVSLSNIKDYLKALYELEYKYHMINNNEFVGHFERKENILKKIKEKLTHVIIIVKDILLNSFKKWLDYHAILNPEEWAEARLKSDLDNIELFHLILSEYKRYVNPNSQNAFYDILNDAVKKINLFPELKDYLELFLEDMKNTWYEEDIENINYIFDTDFTSDTDQETIHDFIDNITLDYLIKNNKVYILIESVSEMEINLNLFFEYIDDYTFMKHILQYIIFPHWYQFWISFGIEDTRENIEKIFKQLQNINPEDIENSIPIISIALQATHQNGEMLDYIADDTDTSATELRKILTNLSNRKYYITRWNKELREIGVKI